MSGRPINVPGEKGPRTISTGEAIAKGLGFQPVSSMKSFEAYKTLEDLKSYRDQKQESFANRYMAAKRKGDRKPMARVKAEVRAWNREMVLQGAGAED